MFIFDNTTLHGGSKGAKETNFVHPTFKVGKLSVCPFITNGRTAFVRLKPLGGSDSWAMLKCHGSGFLLV